MTNKRTTEETTRSPIDGTELVRLATSGANWKSSLSDIVSTLVPPTRSVLGADLTIYVATAIGTLVGGAGYAAAGIYDLIPLTGGSGTGATATVTVSGGAVTKCWIKSVNGIIGNGGYQVGDILSADNADLGGSGAGFTFTITIIGDDNTADGTATKPWATLGSAYYQIIGIGDQPGIDNNGWYFILQLRDGIYAVSGDNLHIEFPWQGGGPLLIIGNSSDTSAVTLQNNLAGQYAGVGLTCEHDELQVQRITFRGYHVGILGFGTGVVYPQNLAFRSCDYAFENGNKDLTWVLGGDIKIFDDIESIIRVRTGGRVHFQPATLTFDATLPVTFTNACVQGFDAGSHIWWAPPQIVGAVGGLSPRFLVSSGASLLTTITANWAGGDLLALPGTLPGQVNPGGHYYYAQPASAVPMMFVEYGGARVKVTEDQTYYVATTGNDTTGQGWFEAFPWATPQYAFEWICRNLDISRDATVTIQCADGSYGAFTSNRGWVGTGAVNINGNAGDRTAVIFQSIDVNGTLTGILRFQYIQATNIAQSHAAGTVEFNSVNTPKYGAMSPGVRMDIWGDYNILAGGDAHLHVQDMAYMLWEPTTVTASAAMNFTTSFLFAVTNNLVDLFSSSNAISGTITGSRFFIANNTVVNGLGWTRNGTPGNADGFATSGAVANFSDITINSNLLPVANQAPILVTDLPTASSTNAGTSYMVSDAVIDVFWSVVAGSSSTVMKVTSDGTNWRLG